MTEKTTLAAASFTRDDFAQWAEHPVTKWVGEACAMEAKDLQDRWIDMSWVGGKADRDALIEMRAQAGTLELLASPTYDSLCGIRGEEPSDG